MASTVHSSRDEKVYKGWKQSCRKKNLYCSLFNYNTQNSKLWIKQSRWIIILTGLNKTLVNITRFFFSLLSLQVSRCCLLTQHCILLALSYGRKILKDSNNNYTPNPEHGLYLRVIRMLTFFHTFLFPFS